MNRRNALFRTKPVDQLTTGPGPQMRRELGVFQLTMLGIGAIIGAGIYSTVGSAAAGGANHAGAGPALTLSFVLVAITCGFAALCYAEFASMAPAAGSAYSYAYASFGELAAWLIGWDLIIEYAIGNVALAISWSAYFQELLRGLGATWPAWLGVDYRTATQAAQRVAELAASGGDLETLSASVRSAASALQTAPHVLGVPIVLNVPAALIVLLLTWVLVRGIHLTARWNSTMVVVKLAILLLFLGVGVFYVKPENWTPFAPNGFAGISAAAAIIFFAYIGFDAITTAAEEARNPQRDLPKAILASLGICTALYVAVALVLTGMVSWKLLGSSDPLAAAFAIVGSDWMAGIISFGAVVATASVLLVFQLGQPRIFYAMARDGLLPPWAAKVHPRYQTPHVTTITTGLAVAAFAAVANLDEIVELTNIGTLFAFVVVAAGVIALRRIEPGRERGFRTPLVPWVPLAAMVCCIYLMVQLPGVTWLRFAAWMGIGLVFYLVYGRKNSALAQVR